MRQNSKTRYSPLPSGFSMIEILVTMGIVITLAAILFTTLGNSLTGAKVQATRVTILKINEILKQQRTEFEQAEQKNHTYPQKATFGGFGLTEADELYAKKLRMKIAFPQRFEDLVGPDGVAGQFDRTGAGFDDDSDSDTDVETLNGVSRPDLEELGQVMPTGGTYSDDSPIGKLIAKKITDGEFIKANHTPETESSELLYLTITSSSFGSSSADADQFSANEVADTDGDGLLEFVDAWGNPLRFYRWPTRLIRPDTDLSNGASNDVNLSNGGSTSTFWKLVATQNLDQSTREADPDDPTRKMYDTMINKGTLSGQGADYYFNEGSGTTRLWSTFHTPYTFHTFLIISTGPDGELGLLEPFNIGEFGHLAQPTQATLDDPGESALNDNVTNLKSNEK